jgi:hypothetical protein
MPFASFSTSLANSVSPFSLMKTTKATSRKYKPRPEPARAVDSMNSPDLAEVKTLCEIASHNRIRILGEPY